MVSVDETGRHVVTVSLDGDDAPLLDMCACLIENLCRQAMR
jgi:hypothetical protein